MAINNIVLIAAAEILAVLLIFCVVLLYHNRSLRRLVKKLQERMEQIVRDLRSARHAKKGDPIPAQTFKDHINNQIDLTKQFHAGLNSQRDIVLDLAPDTELPKRAAALRYAVLLAEKEALANAAENAPPNWDLLKFKYEQIFSFYEDFTPEPEQVANHEEVESLHQELQNAKKRINNLEKFKALYFDLEEQWETSKANAQNHYNNLSEMASKVEDRDAFEFALDSYHTAYNNVNKLIEQGIDAPYSTSDEEQGGSDNSSEIRRLREVAADQHRIITELQSQLMNAATPEDRNQIVSGLKDELNKQQRFIQESETCIQLMEDELQNANKELSQLRSRLKTLPSLKTQLQEAKQQRDSFELKVYALTSENRKLNKRMKEEKSAIPIDNGEVSKLKKELTDLETRYAGLEEKYLDLKIKQ